MKCSGFISFKQLGKSSNMLTIHNQTCKDLVKVEKESWGDNL